MVRAYAYLFRASIYFNVAGEPRLEVDLHALVTLLHATSNRDLLEQIRHENLTLSQLQLLDRLRGGRVKPTVRQCAQIMVVTRQHASRLVDELANRGYIHRETDDTDSRCKRVVLTDDGKRVAVRLHAARMPAIEDFVAGLTQDQRARLEDAIAPIIHPQLETELAA